MPLGAAAVAKCFGMGKQCDLRLAFVTAEDLRGHRAYRVEPPPAAIVRAQNARFATLLARGLEFEGQPRDRQIVEVAQFHFDQPGELPKEPERPAYETSYESRARAIQVWEGLTDEAAYGLYSCMSADRFRDTAAEAVTVEACMYRMPTGNGVLWIKYKDLIWPCSLVRREALRRAEVEPTNYTIDEWHARGTTERGFI